VRLAPLLFLSLALTGLGCGGSSDAGGDATSAATTHAAAPAGSLRARLDEDDAENSALLYGTSDFAVGENRISFLLVRGNGELVQAPRAEVHVARGALTRAPTIEEEAELVPLGPHSHPRSTESHDHADAQDLYVTTVRFDKPGRYWLLVQPEGEDIQGYGSVDVRPRTVSPPIGSRAPASDTPTLADAPARQLTTARPPDTELLRHSVKESLRDRVPFVVTFATPRFCASRTCGPTVEVVDKVRRRVKGDARFIHVEVYRDNDPNKGVNRWMRKWKLPTEPWVFVVDRRGVIRAKFEGSVSVAELEDAVRLVL